MPEGRAKGPVALVKARWFVLPPEKKREVLLEFAKAYDNCSELAFGSEFQADAAFFWLVLRLGASRDWRLCKDVLDDLRKKLTPVFKTQEPFRSAVERLSADPEDVNPQEVLNEINRGDAKAYSALMVRQNAGLDSFLGWVDNHRHELTSSVAALLGWMIAGRSSTAVAATLRRQGPSYAGKVALSLITVGTVAALVTLCCNNRSSQLDTVSITHVQLRGSSSPQIAAPPEHRQQTVVKDGPCHAIVTRPEQKACFLRTARQQRKSNHELARSLYKQAAEIEYTPSDISIPQTLEALDGIASLMSLDADSQGALSVFDDYLRRKVDFYGRHLQGIGYKDCTTELALTFRVKGAIEALKRQEACYEQATILGKSVHDDDFPPALYEHGLVEEAAHHDAQAFISYVDHFNLGIAGGTRWDESDWGHLAPSQTVAGDAPKRLQAVVARLVANHALAVDQGIYVLTLEPDPEPESRKRMVLAIAADILDGKSFCYPARMAGRAVSIILNGKDVNKLQPDEHYEVQIPVPTGPTNFEIIAQSATQIGADAECLLKARTTHVCLFPDRTLAHGACP